jgi:flagellar hook-associated protein 1 FlgK
VLSTLGDVAGRINAVRNDIDGITADATVRLSDEVDVVNDLSRRVADINRLSAGDAPPDLADERDRAIDQLSQLTGAKAEVAADGSIRVTVNGMAIVDGDRAMALRVDPANPGVVLHPAGPIVAGGVVGGLQSAITKDLPGQRGRLDSFANTMMTALNAQHALNLKADGTAGGPLLADTGGTMTVVVTNPNQLAAASASGGAQNGQGADALAGLRTSIDSSARTMIGGVTNEVGALTRAVTSAKTTSESAAGSRDSVTGVNIDEEMTSLIAFQRSYAAAAKVITTVDAMLDTLIRM